MKGAMPDNKENPAASRAEGATEFLAKAQYVWTAAKITVKESIFILAECSSDSKEASSETNSLA